ncbi:hypothetical protein ACF05T_28570 [Streptomyces lateritius]|uniref:Integral membrane protein n=1 Tax=Streptomyces lateritius TaxID=67313 RepID=A0ABW6YJR7_9ACTN
MALLQVQVLGFVLVTAFIAAFIGHRLAMTDGASGGTAWGWAGLSAAAAVVDLGIVHSALELPKGAPSPARIGATALGLLCAVAVAVVAHGLAGVAVSRGRRWCITATAFSVTMGVLAVVINLVG